MARLFITPREIDFINDLNKEITHDVIGQKVYLYPISEIKTNVHDVYRESPDKIFDNPIEIFGRVAWQRPEPSMNQYGYEKRWKLEFYVSQRDMLQREIQVTPGDFFSYDSLFYEILEVIETHNIFGQVEYIGGLKIVAKQARKENFFAKVFGPTNEAYTDPNAIQDKFYQQRGLSENAEGATGDVRDLQRRGVLEAPLSTAEISPLGTVSGSAGSSFYDEK
jgi:hypothetical protein